MDKYQIIKYVDQNGDLVGYRSDSVGSISKSWGKVYKDAQDVFDQIKTQKKSRP